MPEQREMVIAGLTFTVSTPYAEGQTINAAEAKALNQTRCENISNAMRKKIDDLKGDGEHTEQTQAEAARLVAEYDREYEFSLSNAGGGARSKDPLQKEAESLARAYITEQLRGQGRTVKSVDKEVLANKIAEVAENPKIIALAKKRLAERGKTMEDLVDLSDLPAAAPAEPEAEPQAAE